MHTIPDKHVHAVLTLIEEKNETMKKMYKKALSIAKGGENNGIKKLNES